MALTAGWLWVPFFFSTVSLNIPYQFLEEIQKNGRKQMLRFVTFLESMRKSPNYS